MQRRSHNACAGYEMKTLPTSKSWCQRLRRMLLIQNKKSRNNFSIVTTTNIFDLALELWKRKDCRLLQIFARNTECCQSERASLAWCKKSHCIGANRSPIKCRQSMLRVC